jgi:hypothetical protein
MKISIDVTPESPEELARLFAFISGRDGIELPPLAAAAVAKASVAENAAAEAEEITTATKKAAKKATKKATKKAKSADTKEAKFAEAKAEPAADSRKQVENDLRAFAAEHGMPQLRDALKDAALPRLQDASDDDLPKFRAVLDGLRGAQQGDLL